MARKTFVILCIILAIRHVLIGEGRKKQPITKGRKDTMKGIPMKRYTVAFTMLLTFALLFGLTACQQNEAVSPATDGVMESTPPSEQTTVPEITDSEPTAFTVTPDFEVRREPEEISLYPFTAEELDAALKTGVSGRRFQGTWCADLRGGTHCLRPHHDGCPLPAPRIREGL